METLFSEVEYQGSRTILLGMAAMIAMVALSASPCWCDQEPPLPIGLAEKSPEGNQAPMSSEPELPVGLGEKKTEQEPQLPVGLSKPKVQTGDEVPELPAGLGGLKTKTHKVEGDSSEGISTFIDQISGFWEVRAGARTQGDPYQKHASIAETRLQLELEKRWARGGYQIIGDFVYDPVLSDHQIRLERGKGWFDLRSANLSLTPVDFMDMKIGRQILTWGTGDMLFINDMFPKDWNSFFIGRDEEYLKAPSDAIKTSMFGEWMNVDFVYTPRFDSDRFIDGRRISYWNDFLGRRAGRDSPVHVDKQKEWFQDDESAVRLYKNLSGYELALYGYWGYWKSPGGANPMTFEALFPELSVYGASARGALLKGIANVEFGYYDSRDDPGGDAPTVRNSEMRFLVGYEREIARDLTASLQYYVEWMMDYEDYLKSLPMGVQAKDEDRHVVTMRLRKLLMSQNLELSLFGYFSPSDSEMYLRPNVHYKVTDNWSTEIGANVFLGEEDHTFFGQFEEISNVYVATRYSF